MSLSYTFSNLCGAPYEGGSIIFTPDGSTLASPSGNRVSIYDLRHNKVITLPFEARENIKHLLFAPGSPLLLTIDTSGRCLVTNFVKGVILSRINFKGIVADAKFSPCGLYFAIAVERKVRIWDTPTPATGWQFLLRREIRQHHDRIVSLDWSKDSNFIVTAAKDLTVKIFSRDPIEGFSPTTFVDHRYPLRAAFFTADMRRVISVSRDGAIIAWKWLNSKEVENYETQDDETLRNRGFHLSRSRAKLKRGYSPVKKEEVDVKGEEGEDVDEEQAQHRKSKRRKIGDAELSAVQVGEPDTNSPSEQQKFPSYRDGKWILEQKVFCNSGHNSRISRCCYHAPNGLLVVGFVNGVISLYDCPSFDALYTLSIGSNSSTPDSLCINHDGEWIGMGSAQLGQLVVWEWRSETYLLKQQGHRSGIRCVATAPTMDAVADARGLDGRNSSLGLGQKNLIVVTGGEDGKVKLWDSQSGFNYMTFTEHIAPVNDVVFTPQGNAVISASSDGSIRAFDLTRYRNFRTFTSTLEGVQFNAVAVDGGGEIVVAGCQGAECSVLVWSIQTGKLLEKLSGHQGPVVSVQFHPHPSKPGVLLSGSWDATIRVWDIFGRSTKGGASEPLINTSGVLCVAFDPRANNQLAAATLSGNIWIWDCEEAQILGSVDGLRDIHSGRRIGDKFTANNSRAIKKNKSRGSVGDGVNQNQHFSSITYSSNGAWILASSKNSARVCVYDSDKRVLLHAFQLTRNLSLDGILLELNSRYMMETGYTLQELDLSDSEKEEEFTRSQNRIQEHLALPGTQQGEFKGKRERRNFHCWQLCFAQNGQHWCAATSHGVFVYVVDPKGIGGVAHQGHVSQGQLDRFAPNLITQNVTPSTILDSLNDQEFSKAMILSLALNDFTLLTLTYTSIPYNDISVVVQSIPPLLIPSLLNFLRVCLLDVAERHPPKTSTANSQNSHSQQSVVALHGSPHLQYHLKWLTAIFTSAHLASLQRLEPTFRDDEYQRSGEGIEDPQKALLAECGVSASDIRTLCLLLLRSIQKIHLNLSSSFGSNLRFLDFILSARSKQL